MATFKVGQRVRIARDIAYCQPEYQHLLGMETVITSERFSVWGATGYRTAATDLIPTCIGVPEEYLSPLTDPGFDAFMQSVLKPVNLDQPVTVQ